MQAGIKWNPTNCLIILVNGILPGIYDNGISLPVHYSNGFILNFQNIKILIINIST